MLSKLRRWLREGAILLVVLAGVIILLDVWRSPQMPAMFDSTPLHTLDGETVTLASISEETPGAALLLGELVRYLPFHHAGCRPFAVGRGERHDHRAAFR